jgi:capsular polysaccharide export protein
VRIGAEALTAPPFLRLPPFPRSRPRRGAASWQPAPADVHRLADQLRQARVGGCFWGSRPELEPARDLLLVPENRDQALEMLAAAEAEGWSDRAIIVGAFNSSRSSIPVVSANCDPWHIAAHAREVWAGAGHELALIAGLLDRKLRLFGAGPFAGLQGRQDGLAGALATALAASAMVNPYDGGPLAPTDAITLLADWRKLIDSNRPIRAVFGVARWKRVTVDPLLWDGNGPVRYARASQAAMLAAGDAAIAWKSRTPAALLAALDLRGIAPGEIEDGMIRSVGLGANCVPPLSVIVDRRGIYFDPSAASDLETILAEADMPPELLARAAALRASTVAGGISKYGRAAPVAVLPRDSRRRVLVTGQVEDDRSILTGGAGMTNLAVLAAARKLEPDAWIVYKPHPDVEAGHRKGRVSDGDALRHADVVEREAPITALIDSVDALHVITSLAGFEALLRGKDVTTHGTPFYAGWGLTRDLGNVPPRRRHGLTLDALVAGTLILYSRYVDPVTRLPCGPELVIERISSNLAKVSSPLIVIREWQGQLRLALDRSGHRRRMGRQR